MATAAPTAGRTSALSREGAGPPGLIRAHWPLALAVVTLLVCTGVLVVRSRSLTDGHQAYALDDAYIHLAMARSVAKSGVWGITPGAFTSATSSPLWTGLLGGLFALGGAGDSLPLVLNLGFAVLLLVLFYRLLRRAGLADRPAAAALVFLILAVPLPPLILVGMEHTLHACLSLAVLAAAAALLDATSRDEARRARLALLVLAPLLTATRYEGLFLVCAVCLTLMAGRRLGSALAVGLVAWIPPVGYGLASLHHGSLFWPNSLLLKAAPPALDTPEAVRAFATAWLSQLLGAPHLLVVLVAGLVPFLLSSREARAPVRMWLAAFAVTLLLHLEFARVGWFYRYEAYLVVCGIAVATLALARLRHGRAALSVRAQALAGVAVLAVAAPLVYRGAVAMSLTPRATANVYQQQVQMARFVRRYYAGAGVAVNDIGAVAYYGGASVLDLWGLADLAVLRAKREGRYTSAVMDSLARARQVRLAIVYPGWLRPYGGVPPSWIETGRWTTPRNVVLGDATVSFYALSDDEADALRVHLREFGTLLPRGVRQEIAPDRGSALAFPAGSLGPRSGHRAVTPSRR
jgi:hypothetical protein